MSQPRLFAEDEPPEWWKRAIRAPSHWRNEEQIHHAERCAGEVGRDVILFLRDHWHRGQRQFRMEELRQHVGSHRAPDTSGRILRLLRQNGVIDYRVVDRGASLYEMIDLPPPAKDD